MYLPSLVNSFDLVASFGLVISGSVGDPPVVAPRSVIISCAPVAVAQVYQPRSNRIHFHTRNPNAESMSRRSRS